MFTFVMLLLGLAISPAVAAPGLNNRTALANPIIHTDFPPGKEPPLDEYEEELFWYEVKFATPATRIQFWNYQYDSRFNVTDINLIMMEAIRNISTQEPPDVPFPVDKQYKFDLDGKAQNEFTLRANPFEFPDPKKPEVQITITWQMLLNILAACNGFVQAYPGVVFNWGAYFPEFPGRSNQVAWGSLRHAWRPASDGTTPGEKSDVETS